MDKNKKEKEFLYEWGVNNNSKYHFQQADKKKKSYFVKRQDSSYIREYGFETLPEIMEELDSLWINDEMMEFVKKVVGVAAMKNKPIAENESSNDERNTKKSEDELPAFIYNF